MNQVLELLAEYEAAGVAHLWLTDSRFETLAVYTADLRRVETLPRRMALS